MNLLLYTIAFLATFFSTIRTDDPVAIKTDVKVVESATVEYIHESIEIDGQKYIWTVVIPPAAEKGGAGLLFLHGKGQCGDDGALHIEYGLVPAIEKDPESWPFVILVPQKESGGAWSFHEAAVMQMLDMSIEEGYVDPDRIGITGLSQGGHGTLVFAANHPERFAAAAPVCGYAQVAHDENGERTPVPGFEAYMSLMKELAEELKATPTWLFHGEVDRAVPVFTSRLMYKELQSLDADVKYTEFPGVDHDSWDPAYAMSELGDWFASHLTE
jgi:predicted peptidase